MLNNRGLSPTQHVFGRIPELPVICLQDQPGPVAATSPLFDAQAARTQAIRTAARNAVALSQDDASLRAALNARPGSRGILSLGILLATGALRNT